MHSHAEGRVGREIDFRPLNAVVAITRNPPLLDLCSARRPNRVTPERKASCILPRSLGGTQTRPSRGKLSMRVAFTICLVLAFVVLAAAGIRGLWRGSGVARPCAAWSANVPAMPV